MNDDRSRHESDGESRPTSRPSSPREGFKVLPGGSYRDQGPQLGQKTAGELADVAVDSLMEASAARHLKAQRQLMRIWRSMPEIWQRHAHGFTVRQMRVGRELLVFLDSSAWVYELSMRKDEVIRHWNELARLYKAEDSMHIVAAQFRVSRRAYADGASNALSIVPGGMDPQPVPLDDAEMEQVESTCSHVTDERLRKRLQDAMTSVKEWKKSK